jgi:menaquinone-9 beta-reductase
VVGGGPAGAVTASLLASAGREVTLIERQAGPHHKVCGDFLSTEAADALGRLGIDLPALGAAPITALRLVHRCHVACLPLPFRALGLTRRTLDEALLDRAVAMGAIVLRGRSVRAINRRPDGSLTVETTAGAMTPTAIFLATGKHDVRGPRRRVTSPPLVGFKTYLRLAPAQVEELRNHIELVLFSGGYGGLQLVEGDDAVLCILASRRELTAAGGKFDHLLNEMRARCAHLARRLDGATGLIDRPVAISGLPYGFLHQARADDPPLLFRVGDQACVIPSLTGDGVALAVHSARLAATTWLAGGLATAHHAELRQEIAGQMRRASLLHQVCLAPALQPLVAAVARCFPSIVKTAAVSTRISAGALSWHDTGVEVPGA